MKNGKAQAIITGSLVITLVIGTLNKLYKTKALPKFRFYAGTGVLYLMLTGLAEFEEEIAKNIAIAILVFTVVGEGGGVIDNFMGQGTAHKTLDTRPGTNPKDLGEYRHTDENPHSPSPTVSPRSLKASIQRRDTGLNATAGTAFSFPIRPLAPNYYQVDLRTN